MKKILIVDTNYGFTSDIESRLILDEIDNIEISTRNKIENIHDEIESIKPDEVIIFANLLTSHPTWDFGVPVKTYARDASGLTLSSEKQFPCYGIVKNAGDLITAIENNRIVKVENQSNNAEVNQNAANIQTAEQNDLSTNNINNQTPINMPQANPNNEVSQNGFGAFAQGTENTPPVYPQTPQASYGQPYPQGQPYPPNPTPSAPMNGNLNDYLKENREAVLAALLSGQTPTQGYGQNSYNSWGQTNTAGYITPSQPSPYGMQPVPGYLPPGYGTSQGTTPQYPNGMTQTEYEVAKDAGAIRQRAKVASIYSAKGGVGKTTLSCELATFLALTSHGRGKYRVCIIDFNIDFGNVLNTLDFNPKAVCMTHWAQNIKERLARGEKPDNIQYNQNQIESFLQHKDKDGLYALLAPLTNLDSMTIKSAEIEIMLKNIIYNGGFDYVICDTGNNTRDATYLALNYSDLVFLILTQSVNTANSNQSFLMTMPSNFDMSKIRTVINMVKSEKVSGASVAEVKDSILNPVTRKPFECIAEIKHLNDVQKAENIGEPLVYDAGHEFTQNIANIAKHLVGDAFVLPEIPKSNPLTDLLQKIGALKK